MMSFVRKRGLVVCFSCYFPSDICALAAIFNYLLEDIINYWMWEKLDVWKNKFNDTLHDQHY